MSKDELKELLLENITIEVDASQENVSIVIKFDGEVIASDDDYISY